MSISRLGFVSGGGGGGLSEGEVLTLIDQETDTLFTRTQYQSTTPSQNRLTTFEGRLRLQPIPGGADQEVIFPDYRHDYPGSTLRTNHKLSEAELVWQFPSFITRYMNSNFIPGATIHLSAIDQRFNIMPLLVFEQTSTVPTFQFSSSGVQFLGASNQSVYRVVFSAQVGVSINPDPVRFTAIIEYRTSSDADPIEVERRSYIVRKDADPKFIYLEFAGKALLPGLKLTVIFLCVNVGTLDLYDASFNVTVN